MSKYRIQPEGILEIKTKRLICRGENIYVIEKRKKWRIETFQVTKFKNHDHQTIEDFKTRKEMMDWIDQDGGKKNV